MAVAASRALKLSNMTRDPGLGGSIDSSRDLFRLKEGEDKRYPELSPDAAPQKNRVVEQAIVEPSNSNVFEGLGSIPATPQKSAFDGLDYMPVPPQKSAFEGLDYVPAEPSPTPAAPKTMAEADKVLNPELEMAGGTPQESHSQLHETARVASVLAKHGISGVIGGAPDMVATLAYDVPAVVSNHFLGTNAEMAPKVSHAINEGIDKLTGGATKTLPQDRVAAAAFEGAGSMLGGGLAGKGVKWAAEKVIKSNPTKWVERAAKLFKGAGNVLGSTEPALVAAGAAGAGATEYLMNDKRDNWGAAMSGGLGTAVATAALGRSVVPIVAKGGADILGAFAGTLSPKMLQKNSERRLKNILKQDSQGASIRNEVLGDMAKGDAPYVSKETLEEFKTLSKDGQKELARNHTKDYVKFLMEMEERQGIELTAGEITASPKLRKTEDSFANNINIDDMGNFLTTRKVKLFQKAKELTDSIPGSGSAHDFGVKVDAAMKNNLDRLKKIRADEWAKDFGAVADKKIIPASNLIQTLKEFSAREASNEGYKVSARLANEKLNLLKKSYPEQQLATQYGVKVDAPLMSPKQINDWLVGFNEDLRRIPSHKRFSAQEVGKIKAALDADLDIAAQAGNADAALIRKAREGFRENSKIINDIENSYLHKKLENLDTPERITKAFQSMEPSEIRNTLSFLEGAPEKEAFLKDIQKYYLEKATSAATTESSFSVAKFLKELPKKEILDDVFKDASMYRDLKETMRLMRRIKNYGAAEGGSQTAQRLAIKEEIESGALSHAFDVLATGDWKGAAVSAVKNTGRKALNKIQGSSRENFIQTLVSKEKRDALIESLLKIEKSFGSESKKASFFKKADLDPHPFRRAMAPFLPNTVKRKLEGNEEEKGGRKNHEKNYDPLL